MSFWTTMCYCRPGKAPRVSATQLASFVERFEAEARPQVSYARCGALFGAGVDKNITPLHEWEDSFLGGARISTKKKKRLDIEVSAGGAKTLRPVTDALRAREESIYRAEVGLGDVTSENGHCVSFPPMEKGDDGLWLGSAGLSVGPVMVAALDGDEEILVSWLALTISGQGKCWPRTSKQLRESLEALPSVQQAMALCREFWPVDETEHDRLPVKDLIESRRELGRLWPYDELDRPSDWAWVLSESG